MRKSPSKPPVPFPRCPTLKGRHSLELGGIVDHGVVVPRPVVEGRGMRLYHALDGDVVVQGNPDQLVGDLQHRGN